MLEHPRGVSKFGSLRAIPTQPSCFLNPISQAIKPKTAENSSTPHILYRETIMGLFFQCSSQNVLNKEAGPMLESRRISVRCK